MSDDIIEADWRSMSVAQATVTDDAEYITRELASDPKIENHDLREWGDG